MNSLKKKILAITIISLVLLSSIPFFSTTISAEPIPPDNRLVNKFLKILYWYVFGWYNIGSGKAPKIFYAEPDAIEIDYLGNTTVDIVWGTQQEDRDNFHRFQTNIFPVFTLRYEAIFPPEIQEGAFRAVFNPTTFDVVEYDELVGGREAKAQQPTTKLHLYLDIPPNPDNPIQDFILKVNVSIFRKYGNLTGAFGFLAVLSGRFLQAQYSAEIGKKSFNIFVKVKPFRDAIVYVPAPLDLEPNDMKSATVQVQNRGSHVEQFGFRVSGAGDTLFVNTPPPITLVPGETRTIDVGFASKPMVYDRGTLHTVTLDVFACDEPDKTVTQGDLTVRTKGFALQSVFRFRFSWHIFFALATIIFVLLLLAIYHRLRLRKFKKKPKKPWTLPDKKQHLEQLLKENKKQQYNSEIEKLKTEYKKDIHNHKKEIKYELKQQRKQSIVYRPYYKLISLLKSPKKASEKKEKVKIALPKKNRPKTVDVKKPFKKKKETKKKSTNNISISKGSQKQQILDKIKKQQQKIT